MITKFSAPAYAAHWVLGYVSTVRRQLLMRQSTGSQTPSPMLCCLMCIYQVVPAVAVPKWPEPSLGGQDVKASGCWRSAFRMRQTTSSQLFAPVHEDT